MRIGQLAARTGTSERLLRHYEQAGLLTAQRHANGYRDFDSSAEDTVRRIRALLAAGLPTRIIREVLPCSSGDGALQACPGVLDLLDARLAVLDERAAELAQARAELTRAIGLIRPSGTR